VEQVLHAAHAGDALSDGLDARDVLLSLDYPAQEYGAVLGVDVDAPLRDAGAAEELCLDLVRERDVVGRRLGSLAGVQRAPEEADGSRLRAPGAAHGAALAPTQLGDDPVARRVTAAAAGIWIEEVLEQRTERDGEHRSSRRGPARGMRVRGGEPCARDAEP
jgi:hypothetical protein